MPVSKLAPAGSPRSPDHPAPKLDHTYIHTYIHMTSGRDDGGGSRQDRSRPHLPRGGVGSRVVGSICGRRQAVSCARFCFITVEAGRDACIRWAVTGELLGPHAPSALLELSYPRSRARRVLKANGKPPASRGAPHRTRVEIRSGWDSASVGHLVCLVQTCVKGPLCYVTLW